MSVMIKQNFFIGRLASATFTQYLQCLPIRHLSNTYALICSTKRPLYKRPYQTLFINPDGSSFTARYHEPRQVVKLPMDISTLTEEERIKWLVRRKPVKKMVYEDDVKSTFSSKQYVDLVKKKKIK